jgi:hypothetical protein
MRDVAPAPWAFLVFDDVEPTNNHAERVLRPAVVWRRRSFGCHSADGCRYVERLLTVVQSLRLQGRSVLTFLYEAIRAHRSGLKAPSLVPGGGVNGYLFPSSGSNHFREKNCRVFHFLLDIG